MSSPFEFYFLNEGGESFELRRAFAISYLVLVSCLSIPALIDKVFLDSSLPSDYDLLLSLTGVAPKHFVVRDFSDNFGVGITSLSDCFLVGGDLKIGFDLFICIDSIYSLLLTLFIGYLRS